MHSNLKLPSVVFQMPVCSTPVLTEAPARTEVVTLNASVCRRMKETSVRPVSSLLLFNGCYMRWESARSFQTKISQAVIFLQCSLKWKLYNYSVSKPMQIHLKTLVGLAVLFSSLSCFQTGSDVNRAGINFTVSAIDTSASVWAGRLQSSIAAWWELTWCP